MSFKLTSGAFHNEGTIPDKCSRQGGNISPPLSWTGVPEGTTSLALIVEDPDAPSGAFVHWMVYGIPPDTNGLPEHMLPTQHTRKGPRQGLNGFGSLGYAGPQPPSGRHRYVFHLYALDTGTDLPAGLRRQELAGAIVGHIIEETQLMGLYQHGSGTPAAHRKAQA